MGKRGGLTQSTLLRKTDKRCENDTPPVRRRYAEYLSAARENQHIHGAGFYVRDGRIIHRLKSESRQ
jgi:hypothetical protein